MLSLQRLCLQLSGLINLKLNTKKREDFWRPLLLDIQYKEGKISERVEYPFCESGSF